MSATTDQQRWQRQRDEAHKAFGQILADGVAAYSRVNHRLGLPSLSLQLLKQQMENTPAYLREQDDVRQLRKEQVELIDRVAKVFLQTAEILLLSQRLPVEVPTQLTTLRDQVGEQFETQLQTWLILYRTEHDYKSTQYRRLRRAHYRSSREMTEALNRCNEELRRIMRLVTAHTNKAPSQPVSPQQLMARQQAEQYSFSVMISNWSRSLARPVDQT